ncbi:MAG: DUF167 domain-containing protein [Candidatus Hydrogenedentota bacterium]
MNPPKSSIRANAGNVEISLRVQPKSYRDAIIVEAEGRIRVALTAPPVDGKANKALIAFMAKSLGVPKRRVKLIRGASSREKTIRIEDMDVETVFSVLSRID